MSGKSENTLSLIGSVSILLGAVPGVSIFILIPYVNGIDLNLLHLLYGNIIHNIYIIKSIVLLPTLFMCLYMVQLGGILPVTGANYFIVTRTISPICGFLASITAVIGLIIILTLLAAGFAEYLIPFFPGLPALPVAICITILLSLANLRSVKLFESIQLFLVFVLFSALLIIWISSAVLTHPGLQTSLFPKGIAHYLACSSVVTFLWSGLLQLTEVGGDVNNPRHNIPMAFLVVLIALPVLHFLQANLLSGAILWTEASRTTPSSFYAFAKSFLPAWLTGCIFLAALASMASTVNSLIFISARIMYAIAGDQVIPGVFTRRSRLNAPYPCVFAVTVASIFMLLFVKSLHDYSILPVIALTVSMVLGATAVWILPRQQPEIYKNAKFQFSFLMGLFTWIGSIMFFMAILFICCNISLPSAVLYLSLLAVAVIYFLIRKAYLKKNKISLRGVMAEENIKIFTKIAED